MTGDEAEFQKRQRLLERLATDTHLGRDLHELVVTQLATPRGIEFYGALKDGFTWDSSNMSAHASGMASANSHAAFNILDATVATAQVHDLIGGVDLVADPAPFELRLTPHCYVLCRR